MNAPVNKPTIIEIADDGGVLGSYPAPTPPSESAVACAREIGDADNVIFVNEGDDGGSVEPVLNRVAAIIQRFADAMAKPVEMPDVVADAQATGKLEEAERQGFMKGATACLVACEGIDEDRPRNGLSSGAEASHTKACRDVISDWLVDGIKRGSNAALPAPAAIASPVRSIETEAALRRLFTTCLWIRDHERNAIGAYIAQLEAQACAGAPKAITLTRIIPGRNGPEIEAFDESVSRWFTVGLWKGKTSATQAKEPA